MMQSFRCVRLLSARCQLRRTCCRQIGAQVRAVRDRLKTGCTRHPVLVTLVRADAKAPPLNIQQALKVLRLDICRRIQNDLGDVNQVQLWGFYNSSPKTADTESDVWITLQSIGVPKPQHIYTNQQLEHLKEGLPDDESVIVNLSESEETTDASSPTVRNFLQRRPAELLRLSALLETGVNMEQAEGAMQFYRKFLSAVDDRVTNADIKQCSKSEKELGSSILQMLAEQESRYYRHLRDLETRLALNVLWETMLIVNKQLESDSGDAVSPLTLLAARERLVGHLEKLGVSLHAEAPEPAADGRLSTVIDAAVGFRRQVRSFALQDLEERKELMAACDSVRDSLLQAGVKLQDKKNQASWLWTTTKK